MSEFDLPIVETHLVAGKYTIQFSLPEGITLGFGQYLQASSIGDLLPTTLFPLALVDNMMLSTPEISTDWKVGTLLHLRGPLGKKFQLPLSTKHLVCVSARDAGHIFEPLITLALIQNTSVVMCTDHPVSDLPDLIEIQSLENLSELLAWADLIMLDLSVDQIDEFIPILNNTHPSLLIFALVHVPMPCAGTSDCGLCVVQTIRGNKLACLEGPIFDWRELRSTP